MSGFSFQVDRARRNGHRWCRPDVTMGDVRSRLPSLGSTDVFERPIAGPADRSHVFPQIKAG